VNKKAKAKAKRRELKKKSYKVITRIKKGWKGKERWKEADVWSSQVLIVGLTIWFDLVPGSFSRVGRWQLELEERNQLYHIQ
jgi:hypothetical protein